MFFDTEERNMVVGFALVIALLIGAWIYFENRYENDCHRKGGHVFSKTVVTSGYKTVGTGTVQFCLSKDGRILDN